MKKNIVLAVLSAKYVHASLAPFCLAAGIKKFAPSLYEFVRIVEGTINQPQAEILQNIRGENPRIIGFSCYIWNIDKTLALCADLKREFPDLIIILGGPEAGYRAEKLLSENESVDFVLAGEGEKSFPEFLRAVFSSEEAVSHSKVPGLFGRNAAGSIYQNLPEPPLNSVPSPLDAGYAEEVGGRIAYFETSRGCPYSCAFCLSGVGNTARFFDLDTVLPELLSLAQSGTRTIKFVDRTFNANAAHADAILAFILAEYGRKIPEGVCFHFEIAGDILRESTFYLLEKMPPGAVQLEIGIQSLNEKTLDSVRRKTDTSRLTANIRRLVGMKNMHIHIDLIAGLPYECLKSFADGFDKVHTLGAHMLQLGFLKLLHGSEMRSSPQLYPCEYDKNAPYEVKETPWISSNELDLVRTAEDALDRVYNSGRFSLSLDYVLNASGISPFEFYLGFGGAAPGRGVPLDEYTEMFMNYSAGLKNVEPDILRDCLIRDRLSSNSSGDLPKFLKNRSETFKKAARRLSDNPETAPKKGIPRGIALLFSSESICFADYSEEDKNPVTGRYPLVEIPLNML